MKNIERFVAEKSSDKMVRNDVVVNNIIELICNFDPIDV